MSHIKAFPLFPLSIFPVPGQQSGLHIFEPRYRCLFDQLEAMEILEFGIPFSLHGKLSGFGSIARLLASSEQDAEGRRDVMIQSTDLFRIKGFEPHIQSAAFQYPTGTIERIAHWESWQLQGSALEDWKLMQALQTPSAEPARVSPSVIDILQEIRPEGAQVNQIVSDLDRGKHPSRLNEMLRFARIVMEQEVQVKSGYFPN